MPSDDEIRQILAGPGTSNWMKVALSTAINRDPVDALHPPPQTTAHRRAQEHLDQAVERFHRPVG